MKKLSCAICTFPNSRSSCSDACRYNSPQGWQRYSWPGVIGFRDQQFTVLIGAGAKGRRGRTTVYIEDIESIEFDSATTAAATALANDDSSAGNREPAVQPTRTSPTVTPRVLPAILVSQFPRPRLSSR